MGIINIEGVLGFWTDGHANELICVECALKNDREFLRLHRDNRAIEDGDMDSGELYFCDRCGKRL